MAGLRFSEEHEWVRVEDDGSATVGISDYAQEQLGEIVFVELPEVGAEVTRGVECAVIESVKAAGELKAPAGGRVLAVNEDLADAPETINAEPTGGGWIMRIQLADDGELEGLMDEDAYTEFLASLD